MATLKEKINYITNQFSAGKPAVTGEASTEFLIGVINELAADDSNYTEFKDSIPAIHKAAMEEINIAPQDSKHLLVSSMLKNSGISISLKDENTTQKPIFVEFLLEKAKTEGDDELHKVVSELMVHAFDEKNKRIEVSSLIAVTNKAMSEVKTDETNVLNLYVSSKNFDGDEYIKFCGALNAFDKLKDSFGYDLTENQEHLLKVTLGIIEKTTGNGTDELKQGLKETEEKYSKYFFSNDLDIEAQLHKVRSEESLAESAGMISGHDLGNPLKDILKEQADNKADQEKFDLMLTWEEKYNNYLKKLPDVRIMTSGDKFNKRFAHHGFAPSTANLFGDSIVNCDTYGDPKGTLWNISPLTGTMKLSRDLRYDDIKTCEKAFAIAALNARRQGWDTVFLNHPGPDLEAKTFIKHSFEAMVQIGDYSFDQIKVPRRYQHVLDKLIMDALTGSIKNDANVTDELRNATALRPEPVTEDTPEALNQTQATPAANASSPDGKSNVDSDSIRNELDHKIALAERNAREQQNDTSSDTVIPNSFDNDDKIDFDDKLQDTTAPAQEADELELARLEEARAAESNDDTFDDSHLDPERFTQDDQSYAPVNEHDDFQHYNGPESEISYNLPEELKNDQQSSIEGETTPTKPSGHRKIKFGS
jgi:hypothetical protein